MLLLLLVRKIYLSPPHIFHTSKIFTLTGFPFNVQIFEIVNLANELLPSLPDGTISLPVSTNVFVKGSLNKKSIGGDSSKQEDANATSQEVSSREELLKEQPELLQQFGIDLLPVLIQVSVY